MKFFHSLIFTFLVIFNSIELSSQSDEFSLRSRLPAPAGSALRTTENVPLCTQRIGEHLNVSLDQKAPPHHGAERKQVTTSEQPRTQLEHSVDILLPLPLEKWPLLAESLRRDWPAHAEYYYFVITAIEWRSKEPKLPHIIYCPKADYNSGIFVGVSSFGDHFLITFANEGFENLLYKAVTETKMINWAKGYTFVAVASRIITTVHSIVDTLKHTEGMEVEYVDPGNVLYLPKEEAAACKILVPEGCYLDRIKEYHVPLIHSLWPYRNQAEPGMTENEFMTMVRLSRGIGLFSKVENELLSWSLQGQFGEIAVTQTLEKARKTGYGKVVECAFAKELAEHGFDMFGFVPIGNRASEALQKSLNMKVKQPVVYIKTRCTNKFPPFDNRRSRL